MKQLITILFIAFSVSSFSQEPHKNFGEISLSEIEMKSYEEDRDAEAVVLFDIGKSEFIYEKGYGYRIQFTRHKRIKIFKNVTAKNTEVEIPYYVEGYNSFERITSIRAVTFNDDNGFLRSQVLDPSTIYDEKINSSWNQNKFVFPNVQNGSILELEYTVEIPYYNLPDWVFQSSIPTIYSEYEVRMIPFYEYVFIAQGLTKFDYQKSFIDNKKRTWGTVEVVNGNTVGGGVEFQDYVHTYVLKNIPAFVDETYISSVNDYIIKMDFQLSKFHSPTGGANEIMSTWPKLNEALLKYEKFGKYQKTCARSAKKILETEFSLSGKTNLEKSIEIIEYVKNNFTWNGHSSKYASQSSKDFLATKSGNSADINLFLLAMLNTAGINASPVILSTRDHGKINGDYPFDQFTNYVIALVNTSAPFLSDATEDLLPFNKLPNRCFNEKGLLVVKNADSQWITLENSIPSIQKNVITIDLDDEANAEFKLSIQSTEYEAYALRKKYNDDTLAIKEFYEKNIGTISKVNTLSYDNISRPYSISLEGVSETEKLNNLIVIKPFLNLALSKNSLTQRVRKYPVDLVYATSEIFEVSISIPDDYEVKNIPEGYSFDNDLVDIQLDYTVTDNLLKIVGNYQFKKSIYEASEYSKIKYYFDQIVKNFNPQVILEKK
jgi:hypothetical protein